MAQKPKKAVEPFEDKNNLGMGSQRLENLLALLLVKGEIQTDKMWTLSCAGFGATEIARLLGTTPNTVSVALSNMRKSRK